MAYERHSQTQSGIPLCLQKRQKNSFFIYSTPLCEKRQRLQQAGHHRVQASNSSFAQPCEETDTGELPQVSCRYTRRLQFYHSSPFPYGRCFPFRCEQSYGILSEKVWFIMKTLIICMINFYRKHISPLFPPKCRFYPTCSQYALEAVTKYGALKGSWLAVKRLLKCHPFHPGGYDPLE